MPKTDASENDIVTRGYSLPRETFDKLVQEADQQQRNTSNMLTVILNDYFARKTSAQTKKNATQPAQA